MGGDKHHRECVSWVGTLDVTSHLQFVFKKRDRKVQRRELVEETRVKLVAAVLASFKFDSDRIEALEEDEQVEVTTKLAVFAIATADTCLQILLDNPYIHAERTNQ